MKKEIKEKFAENKKDMAFYDQDGSVDEKKEERRVNKKNKKPYKKVKIKPIHLTYTVEAPEGGSEQCFFDILNSITENCAVASDFLCNIDEINSFDDYVAKVSSLIAERAPQLIAKKNIHVCFSVSANRVHIRLEGDVAFTIEVKYKVIDKVAAILSCTGTIIMYAKNDDLHNDLIEAGWVEIEK